MFIKLRDFNDTRTVVTDGQHFAVLDAMNIVYVIVFEIRILYTAVVAHGSVLVRGGFGERGEFFVDDSFHVH